MRRRGGTSETSKAAQPSADETHCDAQGRPAKLHEWLAPHVEAINAMYSRLVDKRLDEYDEIRFHAGWARQSLNELLYVAGKAAGLADRHSANNQAE
jgi:hypothetical protein